MALDGNREAGLDSAVNDTDYIMILFFMLNYYTVKPKCRKTPSRESRVCALTTCKLLDYRENEM